MSAIACHAEPVALLRRPLLPLLLPLPRRWHSRWLVSAAGLPGLPMLHALHVPPRPASAWRPLPVYHADSDIFQRNKLI